MTSVAAVATGATVAGGVLGEQAPTQATPVAALAGAEVELDPDLLERRSEPVVSRSDRRGETDATKAAALSVDQGVTVSKEEDLATGDPRDVARVLLDEFDFAASEFSCLDALYVSESNWRVDADNPTSSAYGIPQALTATHDLPEGYMTSAEVQIRWGLEYIANRYGTPCQAWSFKRARGWY
jgi:hypothetical protein